MAVTTALRLRPHARNEDRARVVARDGLVVIAVVDGAGGMPGGAEAADLTLAGIELSAEGLLGADQIAALLRRLDDECEGLPLCGEAACVVVAVADGRVFGASVGDCEAWLISGDVVAKLTQGQHRKKRIGSGRTVPIAFEGDLHVGDVLVVGSDGLFGYVTPEQIVGAAAQSDVDAVAQALLDAAVAPPVALADDLAVVVLTR